MSCTAANLMHWREDTQIRNLSAFYRDSDSLRCCTHPGSDYQKLGTARRNNRYLATSDRHIQDLNNHNVSCLDRWQISCCHRGSSCSSVQSKPRLVDNTDGTIQSVKGRSATTPISLARWNRTDSPSAEATLSRNGTKHGDIVGCRGFRGSITLHQSYGMWFVV
jgi:hypothetical protein